MWIKLHPSIASIPLLKSHRAVGSPDIKPSTPRPPGRRHTTGFRTGWSSGRWWWVGGTLGQKVNVRSSTCRCPTARRPNSFIFIHIVPPCLVMCVALQLRLSLRRVGSPGSVFQSFPVIRMTPFCFYASLITNLIRMPACFQEAIHPSSKLLCFERLSSFSWSPVSSHIG